MSFFMKFQLSLLVLVLPCKEVDSVCHGEDRNEEFGIYELSLVGINIA